MSIRDFALLSVFTFLCGVATAAPGDSPESFADDLASIQREFDAASFRTADAGEREAAFEALVRHAASFRERYAERVEAVAWEGIVLSAYAGELGAFGAMRYAKAARDALHAAERMDPEALDGGVYASLGALYSKVPGGLIGFGDDDLAAEYFEKALATDAGNIDANFFYGEFLVDQKRYAEALAVLRRGLEAPQVSARPVFDAARRSQIEALLRAAEEKMR